MYALHGGRIYQNRYPNATWKRLYDSLSLNIWRIHIYCYIFIVTFLSFVFYGSKLIFCIYFDCIPIWIIQESQNDPDSLPKLLPVYIHHSEFL